MRNGPGKQDARPDAGQERERERWSRFPTTLPISGSPHPSPLERSPHLGHADHALGHVQVALVVLADLGNDEARVLPAHPPPGTQLQLQRHRCCPDAAPLHSPRSRGGGLRSFQPAARDPHVAPATSARARGAANPRAPPANPERGRSYPPRGRGRGTGKLGSQALGLEGWPRTVAGSLRVRLNEKHSRKG